MSTHRIVISPAQALRPLFAGVDIGGGSVKLGLVDDEGRTLAYTAMETHEERGPEDAVQRISHALRELAAGVQVPWQELAAIGVGTPGTMDIPKGLVLEPPNMPHWRHFPLRDRLQQTCGKPVSFANDANAAAYGEFWVGCGREFHSIVLLTLGTGVGGGIIIGELSVDGEHSHGSECGHIIIDSSPTARQCSCGQLGHLEAYASATALVKRTEEALAEGRRSSLGPLHAQGVELNGLLLAQHAEAGDALALDIILATADYLAIGIVSLMHTVDPGAVVLGGAMNFGGEENSLGHRFIERIRRGVQARTFPVLAARTTIAFACLGGDAGYIGAAGIARNMFRRHAPMSLT